MSKTKQYLLALVNRAGQLLPKRILRMLADSPPVFRIMHKLSRGEFREINLPEGYHIYINPLFHSNLVKTGDIRDYEPQLREAIIQYCKPGMSAWDVGANVGVFTFLFASRVGNEGIVYAFEPEQNNLECLLRSIQHNQVNNIIPDRRAISDSVDKQRFDRRGGAFSGRLIGTSENYRSTDNIETVETVSIDWLVREKVYRVPDIIKIDVEGNEFMVLNGMRSILRDWNPLILCEIHTHLGDSSLEVFRLLQSHNYSITDIRGRPVDVLQPASLRERHIIASKQTARC